SKHERGLWDKAMKRYTRYDVDRGMINGLDQIQAQEVFIDARARGLAEADLAKFFTGKSSKAVNKELQDLLGVNAKGQRLDDKGRVIVSSLDEAGELGKDVPWVKLTAQQQAQANSAAITQMSLVGHKEDLRLRNNALVEEYAAHNKWVKAFNKRVATGDATAAEEARLDADTKRLERLKKGLTADRGKIKATLALLNDPKTHPPLPGKKVDQQALRKFDIGFAHMADETQMAGQMRNWDAFQADATALAESLRMAGNEDLADDVQILANTAALNYETVSRDIGSRSEDSKLIAPVMTAKGTKGSEQRLLALPSTGRPDMVRVLSSAISSPDYLKYKGEAGRVFRAQDEDTIANWASRASAKEMAGKIAALGEVRGMNAVEDLLEDANTNAEGKIDKGRVERALDAVKKTAKGKGEIAVINGFAPNPNDPDKLGSIVLFRVTSPDGETVKLIDATGAEYDDYESFKRNNELPTDQDLLLPEDLMTMEVGEPGKLATYDGHQDPVWKQVGVNVGRGLAVLGAAALFTTGVGAPVATGLFVASGVAFGATATKDQYERRQHNQSISWSDPVARQNWITMAATGLVGGGLALKGAGKLSKLAASRPVGAMRMRVAGTGASWAGNATYMGQYGHSLVQAVSHWGDLTPAQRNGFWIDAAIGGFGLAGGGTRVVRTVRAGVKEAGGFTVWRSGPTGP
ncbi:MAG: DUF4781 domain-containing protein, partial [Pseudonocardia sp.]